MEHVKPTLRQPAEELADFHSLLDSPFEHVF
jgi:hypothetical protein